jgi:gamma-glutamylputrescine oxidase
MHSSRPRGRSFSHPLFAALLEAIQVMCAGDVLETFGLARPTGRGAVGIEREDAGRAAARRPLTVEELVHACGIDPAGVAAALTELELAQLVALDDGGYRRLCRQRCRSPPGVGSAPVPTTSYWLTEPYEPPQQVTLAGPADVAVVGAGITGCTCALTLAEAGLRVRLYDAREVAGGASGRNGGFALRGAAAPYPVIVEAIGRDLARELWRWTERAVDDLAEVAGDAFKRTGSLRLAADDEERDELADELEALRSDGFEVEWMEELEPTVRALYPAAILHPADGVLQPARLVRRLAVRAAKAGVEIREHERVGSVAETGADTVVVATDGYPSGLLGPLEGLIVPTRGQVIATEPIGRQMFEIPHYGRHGFDYWHQAVDGRIVAGGFRDVSLQDEFTADEVTTGSVQSALEEFVRNLLGRDVRVDYRWAGIFGLVLDFLPVVGRVPDMEGVWVAGGYSGHGNVLGFACGRLVAETILGQRDPLLELFEPDRLVLA